MIWFKQYSQKEHSICLFSLESMVSKFLRLPKARLDYVSFMFLWMDMQDVSVAGADPWLLDLQMGDLRTSKPHSCTWLVTSKLTMLFLLCMSFHSCWLAWFSFCKQMNLTQRKTFQSASTHARLLWSGLFFFIFVFFFQGGLAASQPLGLPLF